MLQPPPQSQAQHRQDLAIFALLGLGFLCLPLIAHLVDAPFWNEVAMRMMVLAIACMGVNFILGLGGMVSFGHAAFIGLGAYTAGILHQHGWESGVLHILAAIAVAIIVGYGMGALALRTSRLYFIMITLAFAQMLYFLFVSLSYYGGDDGMHVPRSDFGVNFGADFSIVNIDETLVLYYLIWGVMAVIGVLLVRLAESRFGVVLRASKDNPARVRAMGIDPWRVRLVAYVLSAVVAAIAGVMLVNWQEYVSPAVMHWTRSGELLVIVALGGIGRHAGPLLGAVVFLLAEEVLFGLLTQFAPDFAQHWMLLFGAMLIAVVLFARGGVMGGIARLTSKQSKR